MAKLLVVSGPSGTGKGTICKKLIEGGGYGFSVSMTTRKPRPGEVEGKDYFFVSQEEFDETIKNGGFLEYVHKFQKSYGTPKQAALNMLKKGENVILEIEMQGALNVKKIFPEAILIYVLPPNIKSLTERLRGRGTESEEQIAIRTGEICTELALVKYYDYYVVNDNIEKAVERVRLIASGDGEEYRIRDAEVLLAAYKQEEKNAFISRSR